VSGRQNDSWLTYVAMSLLTKLEQMIAEVRYDVGEPSDKQSLWDEWIKLTFSGYGPVEGFDELFTTPYFSRVWTIQEVLLNRNVIICHGGFTAYFRTLLFKAVQDGRWTVPQPMHNHDSTVADVHVENFLSLYHGMLCGKPPTMLEALLLARDRRSTIKHDSIYGTFGLLNQSATETTDGSSSRWLTPSYDRDYYSLCINIVTHLLQDTGNLDILSVCEVRRHHDKDPVVRIVTKAPIKQSRH